MAGSRAVGHRGGARRSSPNRSREYKPLAFALPYGAYGQQGTNDERIPSDLLAWLTGRYEAVFTQDENALAHSGSHQPLGRIQVTRATTGGELHSELQTGR